MVSKGDDIWVLYPVYFDKSVSRKAGRRVPKALAVDNPKVEEIEVVLTNADRACAVEDCAHPSQWSTKRGRVLVSKTSRKEELIQSVARGIKELRRSS